MVLILDNACYHHATKFRSFLHKHRNVLKSDYMPPCRTELKPIERLSNRERLVMVSHLLHVT